MDRLEELINELEASVMRAKKATFSQNDVVVNRRELLDLINRVRDVLPDCIQEAKLIVSNRDNVLREARDAAAELHDNAEKQVREKLSETGILERANAEAEKIIAEAEDYCMEQEANAKHRIDNLLADSEEYLTRAVLTIRQNRADLTDKN